VILLSFSSLVHIITGVTSSVRNDVAAASVRDIGRASATYNLQGRAMLGCGAAETEATGLSHGERRQGTLPSPQDLQVFK
jgi:hypothetical protein